MMLVMLADSILVLLFCWPAGKGIAKVRLTAMSRCCCNARSNLTLQTLFAPTNKTAQEAYCWPASQALLKVRLIAASKRCCTVRQHVLSGEASFKLQYSPKKNPFAKSRFHCTDIEKKTCDKITSSYPLLSSTKNTASFFVPFGKYY